VYAWHSLEAEYLFNKLSLSLLLKREFSFTTTVKLHVIFVLLLCLYMKSYSSVQSIEALCKERNILVLKSLV